MAWPLPDTNWLSTYPEACHAGERRAHHVLESGFTFSRRYGAQRASAISLSASTLVQILPPVKRQTSRPSEP